MAAATADVFWAVRQNRTARPAQNFIKGELQSDKCREASVGERTVKTRLVRARLQLRDLVAPFTTARGLFNGHLFRRGRKPWS